MSNTILVAEDDMGLREALADTLELAGYDVALARDGREAMEVLGRRAVDVVVTDVQMDEVDGNTLLRHVRTRHPDVPVLMMTAYGTVQNAVEAIRGGATDYLVKPFDAEVLLRKVGDLVVPAATPVVDQDLVAVDARSLELVQMADRVAASDATVLITGESGTGKEVLAQYIHRQSRRSGKPFVAINCAAIPGNMLEAVLFGYEKGAFTGAIKSTPGKFEIAEGGTLLLDEVSEMELGLQAKLLRVLQEREVERLGSNRVIPLDVRVLATSNRLLREEVLAGRFREDLFYRLNVFPLRLLPLRERPGDIIPIAEQILAAQAGGTVRHRLDQTAGERLMRHRWPGNVRELHNVMQRAVIMASGNTISAADLQFEAGETPVAAAPVAETATDQGVDTLGDDLRSREQAVILETLRTERGSRRRTAARLGISERTLRYKLARMRESGVALPYAGAADRHFAEN
jgi:two-component system response regulator FlrC